MTSTTLSPLTLPPVNPSRLVVKLMSGLPALSEYSGVQVHDITSVEEWRACGNSWYRPCSLNLHLDAH